jgi:hypothetical protein
VYPDAKIEMVRGGIRLFPSPPPIKRRQVSVGLMPESSPTPVAALPAPSTRGPSGVLQTFNADRLVSQDALDQLSEVAPGWDKYYLESAYKQFVTGLGEMPRNLDRAFLGWAKKFTKGKRP